MKKIAVIGSGISGLTCAHYLSRRYQVTLYEAADYLGFSRASIWKFIKDGTLKSIKLGSSRRIELAELDRFINDNSQEV